MARGESRGRGRRRAVRGGGVSMVRRGCSMGLLRCPRRPHPPTPLSLKGEGGSEKSSLSRSPPPSPFRERGAGGGEVCGEGRAPKACGTPSTDFRGEVLAHPAALGLFEPT